MLLRNGFQLILFTLPCVLMAQEIKYIDLTDVRQRTELRHPPGGQPSSLLFQKTMGAVTTAKWNHRNEELILRFAREDELGPQDLRKTTLGVDVQSVGLNAEKKGPASSRRGALFS